jgi:hypothetical protein
MAPGAQERLLHDVLGTASVRGEALGVDEQGPPVFGIQGPQRVIDAVGDVVGRVPLARVAQHDY